MPRLASLIDRAEAALISVMLGAATVLVFAQVVARYVFHAGINWAPEMVEYLFLWTVMIGASHGVRHKVHLGVDTLTSKLPPLPRRAAALFSVAVSFAFAAGMSYLSTLYVINSYRHEILSVDMGIPLWIPHLALPVGFAFIAIRFLQAGRPAASGGTEEMSRGDKRPDAEDRE